MPAWIVNGDVFADFSRACGTIGASELRERLEAARLSADDIFLPGQGLSEADLAGIVAVARHNGHEGAFHLWQTESALARAPKSLTHKYQPSNSLISVPELGDDGAHVAALLIRPDNEIISDHVTGQHVQGMLLVEACRQMFIAVSEQCHMDRAEGRLAYVVFNKMSVTFKAFTFPIAASIEYRVRSAVSPRPDRLAIGAELSVVQNGAVTTVVDVEYTLFNPDRLRQTEVARGIEAVQSYCAGHMPAMHLDAAE